MPVCTCLLNELQKPMASVCNLRRDPSIIGNPPRYLMIVGSEH